MGRIENFTRYAADCMRRAEGEASDNDRIILLNIAQAWVRLAQQTKAIGTGPDDAGPAADPDAKPDADTTAAGRVRPATPPAVTKS